MNNQSSYCGLVNAKIRATDKDLPVCPTHYYMHTEFSNLPMTLQHSHSLPARLNWMASLRGRTQPRKRQNVGRLLCSLPPTGSLGRHHRPDQPNRGQSATRLCCTSLHILKMDEDSPNSISLVLLLSLVRSLYRSIYSPL